MTARTNPTRGQERRARSRADYRVEAASADTRRLTDPSSPDFDAAAWLRRITRG